MPRNRKFAPGTWVERKLFTSEAYWALTGTAAKLLLIFLSKRDINRKKEVLNRRSITVTYKELENLHGPDPFGKPRGINRGGITRAISDLMAKGFIEVVHQGGGYQKDKTIYGLTDEWMHWRKGLVVRERTKAPAKSRDMTSNFSNPQSATHTHPHSASHRS